MDEKARNQSPGSDFERVRKSSCAASEHRANSVRTHYEKRDIKSILSASRFKPKDGDYLIKPKEMRLVTASPEQNGPGSSAKLFLPLDELEEEEHRKYAATKIWAIELEKLSPVKSIVGKTVSFNIQNEIGYETRILQRPNRRHAGSPKSKDGKTARNSDTVVTTRPSSKASPDNLASEALMPAVAEKSDEEVLQEETKRMLSFGFDLDD